MTGLVRVDTEDFSQCGSCPGGRGHAIMDESLSQCEISGYAAR